jgi:aspartyl-tRNA(Asn)/glutamyl-tRNA(Gln) amidotransferase subunit A
MSDSLHALSIAQLAPLIAGKQLSPVELTRETLRRIESLEPVIKAFIRILADDAIAQAKRLEKEVLEGRWRGPLHGIPVAVKDILQTRGIATTAGSKVLEHWIPGEDATVISKLKQAGAILIGKTNLHEFAMGATTENPHYGTTRNPWNPAKIAGGSSGGSAAALAAGMCFGAIGTDTGGSIRLPSALCGTVGLKPTYGRVSKHGCVPFSWSHDHVGPMGRTVRDTAAMLAAIAGYDPKDVSTSKRPVPAYLKQPLEHLRGITVGVCREYFFEDVCPEIREAVENAISRMERLGAEIVEIHIPDLSAAQRAAPIITQSESYAFHQAMFMKAEALYGEDVKLRLQKAREIPAYDYVQAQRIRRRFIEQTLAAMEQVDLIAAPMNHNPPLDIGSVPAEESFYVLYRLAKAQPVNLLGFPALSVPCGFTSERLPIGLQLIGKPFAEDDLLRDGDLYERAENLPTIPQLPFPAGT